MHGIEVGLDRSLTLNIVIESRVFVAIEIQVFECIVCGEVLVKHKNVCDQQGEPRRRSVIDTSN